MPFYMHVSSLRLVKSLESHFNISPGKGLFYI